MRAKVYIDAAIPVFRRIAVQIVARVVRRIVDQYVDVAICLGRLVNRLPESANV